jgi:outer membrane protein assembly factor BamD (BamD/ComL family)
MKKAFFLLLFVLIACSQQDELLVQRFNVALETYKTGDYKAAESLFRSVRSSSRSTSYYPLTLYMQALCLYNDGNYAQSSELFSDFCSSFTDHPYYFRAILYRANCEFFQGNSKKAVVDYFIAQGSEEKAIIDTAKTASSNLMWVIFLLMNYDRIR